MKDCFKIGDRKITEHIVMEEDFASFNGTVVHKVYSTFALGRDAEWACRQFVLEMKEEHEEGVGTFLHIEHLSPAKKGDKVIFEAQVKDLNKNNVICTYQARVGERLIAKGEQGQKIIKKERIKELLSNV